MQKKRSGMLLSMLSFTFAALFLMAACGKMYSSPAYAPGEGVRIVKGPSPIEGDVLNHPDDITIYNEHLALTIAVGSPNFWGMTNGSISNLAVMEGPGQFGVNIVNDVEFLVNSWTASGGSLKADAKILQNTPERAVVQTTSTWLGDGKANALDVVTTYTLEKNSPVVKMHTRVSNPGPDTYTDMKSGYSMSGLAAYMFGPFGYHTPDVRARNIHVGKNVDEPFGDFVVSYTKDYAITLQMDDTEIYRGTTGYKDLHHNYDLAPGQFREFTGELQVIPQGHTTPFMVRMIEKKGLPSAEVSGTVRSDDGRLYPNPVLVVERTGRFKGSFDGSQNLPTDELHEEMQTFIWHVGEADGSFAFTLPEGNYNIYAIAAGYTASKPMAVTVKAGRNLSLHFVDDYTIVQGGEVIMHVTDRATGNPVDARIAVDGPVPAVKYLGARTYFTDLESIGRVTMPLAVGDFTFKVMSGADFISLPEEVKASVGSGETLQRSAAIETHIYPNLENWYSVDLHHHTDIGDGNTSPEDLVKSQLAARLDLTFVSDHDSVDNHLPVKKFSDARMVGMIPSLEVSPGWGHLNILPMPLNGKIIEPSLNVGEIIAQAHAKNALVIVAHPYTDYGYFNNREIAPGGYDPNFDLIELQPTIDLSRANNPDTRTLAKTMELWTDHLAGKNKAYYLTGGSDTHDVASPTLYSGMIRTYAKVDGDLTPASFIEAVAKGNSYASMGPLFFPSNMDFGGKLSVKAGNSLKLTLDAFAVNGLQSIEIYTAGSEIGSPVETKTFNGSVKRESLTFTVKPAAATWYNFIARDMKGRIAVSNPVWVDVTP
ncbi:hypothetical protein LZ24_01441 [Desulfobotulus alkaliphilus]|uniref:Carboxypeptidase family protein n=1 Tax=Desulfobotulus alkaliphilus TaxID=622671 RepID=A0A562RXH2_9BACT|nr:CehA/McbA family metallohydrolase [Desulfobotulus alkaliphilus]TWI73030.1 hypothetical protein LZ24_01441 [Desulfobotulus alkaliphilus]